MMKTCKFTLFNDYQNSRYIDVNLAEVPHFLYTGKSGTGKITAAKLLITKISKYYPDCVLFLFDFKQDDSLYIYHEANRYYGYTDCETGLSTAYNIFLKRLSN